MSTEPGSAAALLALTQWLSPAFPLGSFAYSHGLEHAIATGAVASAADLARWLDAILQHGSGRSDAILLSLALRRTLPDDALCDLAAALAAGEERWQETRAQGRAFVATTNAILGDTLPPMPLPVAVGVRTRGLGLPRETVLALYLQSFIGNLVMIAIRAVPLGQSEGQACLAGLGPVIARIARECGDAMPGDLSSAALGADLAALGHETQEVRLFQS